MTATPLPRKPTGKLAFAYQTIAALEQVRADLEAEIERLNAAATDSNLILERAQATNLEMLAALARKDALLRQALGALEYHTQQTRPITATDLVIAAIEQELSQ